MLTSDLVRVSFRSGYVQPRYIRADDAGLQQIAGSLIEIFENGLDSPKWELNRALEDFLGTGTAFLLHRGLAKLLLDRCEFETEAAVEPAQLRQQIFQEAAAAWRHPESARLDRQGLVARVARAHSLAEKDFERTLYADLKDEQVLKTFKTCRPDWLLQRYNVALAQAVLLRASELDLRIWDEPAQKYRALFRKLKFFQLMHQITGRAEKGYRIRVDGPLSLFKSSQRYGLQMALFLPVLLHCENWSLSASVLWGKKRLERKFRLSPEDGLQPTTRLTGQWQPEEMRWLLEQFPKLDSDWSISAESELIDLGGKGVLVPDYTFTHVPTGQQVLMEIFGFWRKGAVESRLELLRQHGPSCLILALSKDLHTGEEALADLPGEVYIFRSVPIAREVLRILEGYAAGNVVPESQGIAPRKSSGERET